MSLFTKLNAFNNPFDVTTENPYINLSDLQDGQVIVIDGFFINPKGKYGKHPVAQICNEKGEIYNLSLPKSLTNVFEQILDSDEMVQAVKDGQCKAKVVKYFSKRFEKWCYTINFVD